MSRQFEKSIKLYDGKAYGQKVSDYGLHHGYLDYLTLSKIVGDHVLNNNIVAFAGYENWEVADGSEEDNNGLLYPVFQYYIISESGYAFLRDYTNELVYYNQTLDMYVWAITHFGTGWDYVLTDIKLT